MASFIISSAALSRPTPSHASLVVPFNGLKLSKSAAMTQTHVAPFTGLKSNSTFPLSRKVNNITSLTSNGGRARCCDYLDASALKFEDSKSWTNIGEARAFTGQGSITNFGEIDVSKLQRGKVYEIIYYVYMKTQQVDGSFSLTLDLPNGTSTVTNVPKVTVKVGDPETPISVGKFRNNYKSGSVTFTLSSDKPNIWKDLVIDGVSIIS